MPLTEVSPQLSTILGGNPPGDWQSAVGWGDAGFKPGNAGLQPGTLPLSHHASDPMGPNVYAGSVVKFNMIVVPTCTEK